MAGNLTAMIASIFSGSAVTPDPYYEYTTLLLPGNGTNGAQNNTFLDSGTANGGVGFTITRNGNTTQGTFSPFSQTGWGNYFSGSNSVTSASLGTAIGTSDFSLEFFIYQTASAGIITPLVLNIAGNNIYLQTDSGAARFLSDSGIAVLSGGTVNTNTWNHLVATRQGSTVRLFVNGVLVANTTSSTSFGTPTATIGGATTLYLASTRVCIGSVPTSYQTSSTTNGTTIFTPPTSLLTTSSQGATSADVKLLTCQSNRFIDISDSPKTLTTSGSPTVVAFSPFNPTSAWSASTVGGSGYFDGTGDYLSVPNSSSFNMGTGDFTFECWIYPPTNPSVSYPAIIGPQSVNPYGISIRYGNTGYANKFTVHLRGNGSWVGDPLIASSSTFPLSAWSHVAVTRSGSSMTLWVNGSSQGTATTSAQIDFSSNSQAVYIGGSFDGAQSYFTGYISSLRLVKGTAVYTSAFTPPTAPLIAITNTSLLLNFTNAGIYDATSKNDLETVGNAQISTTQSKWGGSSISFDGTGDWLLIPDQPPQRIGTGKFTIELWVYRNSSGTYGLVGKGTGTTGWLVSLNSSNQVVFTYASSTITSTGTVSATTWTHIAVVREGTSTNQTKIYINGTNDGTGTVSTDFNQTNSMYIGADRTGGSAANAYVQDVRITNDARYTANFTAPTAAFLTL
jgi:hypothetical protein